MSAFAKPTYCYECALEQKPEPAVGYDVDGEPACAVHRAPEAGEPDFVEVKRKAQSSEFSQHLEKRMAEHKAGKPVSSDAAQGAKAMVKRCACSPDCPKEPKPGALYAWGHKPKGVKASDPNSEPKKEWQNPARSPSSGAQTSEESATLVVTLTNAQANTLFLSLTLSDKVRLLKKFIES